MMRPYMLWLARVYAGRLIDNGWGEQVTTNLIGEWIDYQVRLRYMVEAERR